MHYYLQTLKKYAVFSGRAQRAEYWYFFLFNFIISSILSFTDAVIGSPYLEIFPGNPIGLLYGIFSLLILVPALSVGVRRLHDVGKSGWIFLLSLTPFLMPILFFSGFSNLWLLASIGITSVFIALWILILLVRDSNPGENKYGPNPKGVFTKQAISNEGLTKKEKIISWALCIPFPFIAGFSLYYFWKKDAPIKAKQANRISWIALGLEVIIVVLVRVFII